MNQYNCQSVYCQACLITTSNPAQWGDTAKQMDVTTSEKLLFYSERR